MLSQLLPGKHRVSAKELIVFDSRHGLLFYRDTQVYAMCSAADSHLVRWFDLAS